MAKMLKIKEEKRYIAFSAAPIRMKLLSIETMKDRRQWNDICKVLRAGNANEKGPGGMKMVLDKQKVKYFITCRPSVNKK